MPEFEEYLARIREQLDLVPSRAEEICAELRSHLEAEAERRRREGLGGAEPEAFAVDSLGDPAALAGDLARANRRYHGGGGKMARRMGVWIAAALVLVVSAGLVWKVDAAEKRQWGPLHFAVQNGETAKVAALLDHGADADATPVDGNAPLILAARTGNAEAAKLLLTHGAKVNVGEAFEFQAPPLQTACAQGSVRMVRLLLAHGANANTARARDGATPLRVAAGRGHLQVVGILLSRGADVRCRDRLGFTPLHAAAAGGHAEVVSALLAAGAKVNAKTYYEEMTPLRVARDERSRETLRAHGGTL